jgi:diguanylate cyclase (GGDEF)-like protein
MFFRSIKTRMILAVCTLVGLLLAAIALFTLGYFKREFTRNLADQQFTLLRAIAQGVDDKLSRAQGALLAVAKELPVEGYSDPVLAQRFMDSQLALLTTFDNGLFLFSPQGDLVAEHPFLPDRRGLNFAFREYFQATVETGKPHISSPYFSSKHQHPAIMMTIPLFDQEGELLGIFAGSLDLLKTNFLGELSNTRIGHSGYLYIYGQDRTMIIHPDSRRILRQDVPVGANRLFDLALQGFEGTGETVNSRGLHALASFKHMQTVPWILAANYPVAEAYAPIHRAQRFFLAAIFAGALLTMLLVWILMQRLTRPLLDFTRHVERVTERAGEERLFVYGKNDEIGTLVLNFNQMVLEIERQTEALRYLGNHDALTGLYNRRYFEAELERLARGRQSPVSVIMADVNGLKEVNDRLGHEAGDQLIRIAAEVLATTFRAEDIVARIGGDEFAVLLPGAGRSDAEEGLERIRGRLNELCRQGDADLSLALGAATTAQPAELLATLRCADERMYEEKSSRKHRA